MDIINNTYDEEEIRRTIENALASFYNSLISTLKNINIGKIMKSKNPYLYRSKAISSASEIIDSVLFAFISSSEETIFGNCFFEPLAIVASGGTKADAEGVDVRLFDKKTNRVFAIAVKSGTSVYNADSKKKQETNFNAAKKRLTQGGVGYEPIVGYGYGQKKHTEKTSNKSYEEVAGEDFWTMITGDPLFYKKIMGFIGVLPEKYVEQFNIEYANAKNRLTCDFLNLFCRDDGSIDWEKLVECNSESLDRLEDEKEQCCKEVIMEIITKGEKVTKSNMQKTSGCSASYVNKILEKLMQENKIKKVGRTYVLPETHEEKSIL